MINYILQFADYKAGCDADAGPDITDTVFDDKINQMQRKLSFIQERIEQRKEIKESNLQQIIQDECVIENIILQQPDVFTPYMPPSRHTAQLKEIKSRLNDKRRQEIVSAWRDVSMLYNMGIDAYIDLMKQYSEKKMMEYFDD